MTEQELMALDVIRNEQAKRRQERFFRVVCDPRRGGMTLREISEAAGIKYETVRSYAGHKGETAVMSLTSYIALREALPEWVHILEGGQGDGRIEKAALGSIAEGLDQITRIIRDMGERA